MMMSRVNYIEMLGVLAGMFGMKKEGDIADRWMALGRLKG